MKVFWLLFLALFSSTAGYNQIASLIITPHLSVANDDLLTNGFPFRYEEIQPINAIENLLSFNIISKGEFSGEQHKASLIDISANEILTHDLAELTYRWIKSCKGYEPLQEKSQYRNSHNYELYDIGIEPELLDEYLPTINEMEYFDLKKGMQHYQTMCGKTYNNSDAAASLAKDTTSKLEYLGQLLNQKLRLDLEHNYSIRPNGMAGRGKIAFKDHVLAGYKTQKSLIKKMLLLLN